MENAFKPINNRALNALGALIRTWAVDEASRPDFVKDETTDRILVMDVKVFRACLLKQDKNLVEGQDFKIREGVLKVELVLPAPDRLTIAMPDKEALTRFSEPGIHKVPIPAIYGAAEPWNGKTTPNVPDENGDATYDVDVDDQTYGKFVDPYMAAYVCTQCI